MEEPDFKGSPVSHLEHLLLHMWSWPLQILWLRGLRTRVQIPEMTLMQLSPACLHTWRLIPSEGWEVSRRGKRFGLVVWGQQGYRLRISALSPPEP